MYTTSRTRTKTLPPQVCCIIPCLRIHAIKPLIHAPPYPPFHRRRSHHRRCNKKEGEEKRQEEGRQESRSSF